MYMDAEARRAELDSLNGRSEGLLFKIRDDPRITRLVSPARPVAGRAAATGQRPLWTYVPGRPSAAAACGGRALRRRLRRRLLVKPGLTGLWQISGRSDLTWEESVRLDLRYVENWSLSLDLLSSGRPRSSLFGAPVPTSTHLLARLCEPAGSRLVGAGWSRDDSFSTRRTLPGRRAAPAQGPAARVTTGPAHTAHVPGGDTTDQLVGRDVRGHHRAGSGRIAQRPTTTPGTRTLRSPSEHPSSRITFLVPIGFRLQLPVDRDGVGNRSLVRTMRLDR